MSISIDYDTKKNVIYTNAEGVIRLDDTLSYYKAAAALDLKPNYRVLADYSDAILELSSEDIHLMADKRKSMTKTNDRIKISIICGKDHVFGLGRMYGTLLGEENYQVMVFRSEERAREWLGL